MRIFSGNMALVRNANKANNNIEAGACCYKYDVCGGGLVYDRMPEPMKILDYLFSLRIA